jgi:hypothetical protein
VRSVLSPHIIIGFAALILGRLVLARKLANESRPYAADGGRRNRTGGLDLNPNQGI